MAAGRFPRQEYLIDGTIPRGLPSLLSGDGGTGKSNLAIQAGVAVAAGRELFGREVQQSPVLLVLCEDPPGEIQYRLEQCCAALGVDLASLPLCTWPRLGKDSSIATIDEDGAWDEGPFYTPLCAQLRRIGEAHAGHVFCVLDSASDICRMNHAGKEEPNTLAKIVLPGLWRDLTSLLVGHQSKASIADGTGYYGAVSWNNSFRSRTVLSATDTTKPKRTWSLAKANYSPLTSLDLLLRSGYFTSISDLDETERTEQEQGAVLAVLRGLRDNGICVVRTHGHGQRGEDIAQEVARTFGHKLTKKDVVRHWNSLERQKKIHWRPSTPGKAGQSATWEIGAVPIGA
jgi:KaiC/GvpD/RAD55 family RecA-like ATPase